MRVSSVSSTYCFVLAGDQLAQVVRVVVAEAPAGTSATVSLEGPQLLAATPWRGQLGPERAGQDLSLIHI